MSVFAVFSFESLFKVFTKPVSAVFRPKTDKTMSCNLLKGAKQILTNLFFSSGIEDNPTIFYQLIRGSTDQTNKYDTFYLQQRQENGWTYADVKVNQPLDFERIKEYNLTIRVEVRMSKYFTHQTFKYQCQCQDSKGWKYEK